MKRQKGKEQAKYDRHGTTNPQRAKDIERSESGEIEGG